MFSIIIPSYNRNKEIPHLLNDLAQQTMKAFEVVIVDDYSTEPLVIVENYPFPVRVIRNQINLGAAQSRNIGAENVRYNWLLFLDDDDRFSHNKCERLANIIEHNPQVNFIYHPAECVMVNEGFSYITRPYQNEQDLLLDNILKANKIGGMPMLAIKKTLFFKVGGLTADLLALEDYDFVLKIVNDENFKPKYVAEALTKCTFHTQRKSVSTDISNTEKALVKIKEKYVKNTQQAQLFEINELGILAYPYIMNLSRQAAKYYWRIFLTTKQFKFAVIALLSFISPKLAINMKRFG